MEKNLGHATAYGYAKSKGYSGTEEEFAELMADYASVGQSAAQSAEQAAASATSASGSAATASQAAQTATSKASEAVTAADTATTKATESAQSAENALTYKTDAESAKTASQTAQGLAETARDGAVTAKTSAEDARDEAQSIVDGITGKVEQIDSNTDRIESLEDDRYKPYAVDTASGSIASFPDGADGIPLKSCIVQVEPVQDLHGYDHPWPAGGGVNKVNMPNLSIETGVDKQLDIETVILPAGTYTFSYTLSATVTATRNRPLYLLNGVSYYGNDIKTAGRGSWTFTLEEQSTLAFKWWTHTVSAVCTISDFQLELGSTATSYVPYSNECPITGWTGCEVRHSGEDTSNPTTYPITFPSEAGTVYGGYIDPINGELVTCPYYASYNGETLTGEWISDRDKYVAGTTPTIGAQVVNIGAIGERYPITTENIKTLLGTNNIWADTGDVSVEYRADVTKYISKKITEAVSALI